MKSLNHAAKAIEQEIQLTKARLDQLETGLAAVRTLMAGEVPSRVKLPAALLGLGKRGAKAAKGGKTGRPRNTSGLPATGSEFWFGVLGSGKKTMNDIVDGALKKLKLDDTARKVILARATSWLYPAIKAGTIKQAGKKGDLKAYQVAGEAQK